MTNQQQAEEDTGIMFENLGRDLPFIYLVHYAKDQQDALTLLCDTYGSDKGEIANAGRQFNWDTHNYTDYYSSLFAHCRPHIKKVFECGIGTTNPNFTANMGLHGKPGASLRVWRDYFPNAQIIGADLDRDVLFTEDRIKTYFIDQTNSTIIAEFWKNVDLTDFDLILDDGLHEYHAGICLFENSIDKLADHGIYIIEDVQQDDLIQYKDYFLHKNYTANFVNLSRPNLPLFNNNLVVIRKKTV